MNGQTSQKTSYGLFHLNITSVALKYLLLFLFGALAMVIHARLRLHLGIPGHQGFLYMALLITSCSALNTRFGGLMFSFGASTMLAMNILGFRNPMMFEEFLFVGLVADLFLNLSKSSKYKIVFILLVGALGYGMIPLVRLVTTTLTGFPYGSFAKHGFGVTLISHVLFGAAGAISGFGLKKILFKSN